MRRELALVAAIAALLLTTACARLRGSADARAEAPAPAAKFKATSHHPFDDVEKWKHVFDDPKRDQWQKPVEVIHALAVGPGMAVADLGAGTGYFSKHLSSAVGSSGVVFAVDTEPNLVAHLRERAEKEDAANVTPVLASFGDPRLPTGAIDVVLIVDTFHHIDDRLGYFQRLKAVLREGGRIAIIDWKKEELPVGPPPEHKIAREQVIDEMNAAGYVLVSEPTILPYQYFLIFRPR